jgi:hypothetical protein
MDDAPASGFAVATVDNQGRPKKRTSAAGSSTVATGCQNNAILHHWTQFLCIGEHDEQTRFGIVF